MSDPVETAATYEEALEKGFWGEKHDPVPNEDYTLAGVAPEAPPPPEPPASDARKE